MESLKPSQLFVKQFPVLRYTSSNQSALLSSTPPATPFVSVPSPVPSLIPPPLYRAFLTDSSTILF